MEGFHHLTTSSLGLMSSPSPSSRGRGRETNEAARTSLASAVDKVVEPSKLLPEGIGLNWVGPS
jgi:hypothetical protein